MPWHMGSIQYTLVTAPYETLKGHMLDSLPEAEGYKMTSHSLPEKFQDRKTKYWQQMEHQINQPSVLSRAEKVDTKARNGLKIFPDSVVHRTL